MKKKQNLLFFMLFSIYWVFTKAYCQYHNLIKIKYSTILNACFEPKKNDFLWKKEAFITCKIYQKKWKEASVCFCEKCSKIMKNHEKSFKFWQLVPNDPNFCWFLLIFGFFYKYIWEWFKRWCTNSFFCFFLNHFFAHFCFFL